MGNARALDSDNWLGGFVTLGKLLKHSGSIMLISHMFVCILPGINKGIQLCKHYTYYNIHSIGSKNSNKFASLVFLS